MVPSPRKGPKPALADPGRDAAKIPGLDGFRHVYAARSRRSGGLSLGVDLTPGGACSLACIYCQVDRSTPIRDRPNVDVDALAVELRAALADARAEEPYVDVVIAGSGEPTLAKNLGAALAEVARVCTDVGFDKPVRVYSNGLGFGTAAVRAALSTFAQAGGQVWVKVDAGTPNILRRLWGTRMSPAFHFGQIWNFAKTYPIGIQSMLVRSPTLPPIEKLAREIGVVVAWGRDAKAQLTRIDLVAPSRPAGNAHAGVEPATVEELDIAAGILRKMTSLEVRIFP